ncbi:ribonuclease H-like domain-containing protein [Trichophaea hybrida]|nr:ribonuclease H-like domain-containing protein [Trichophaea hybrida]
MPKELPRIFDLRIGTFQIDRSVEAVVKFESPFSHIYYSRADDPPGVRHVDTHAIVVFVDGACGQDDTAGIGCYFGPDSPHNIMQPLPDGDTRKQAELKATLAALKVLREAHENDNDIKTFVIATDSAYVTSAMNEWLENWKVNGWRGLDEGNPVQNLDLFKELDDYIVDMEENGWMIKFWLVSKEDNKDADALAKLACRTKD